MSDDPLRARFRAMRPAFTAGKRHTFVLLPRARLHRRWKKRLIGEAAEHDKLAETVGELELELADASDGEPSG